MPSNKLLLITNIFLVILTTACTQKHSPVKLEQTKHSTSKAASNLIVKKDEFLFQVNQIRKQARKCGNKYFSAAPPLNLDDKLNSVAHQHSTDMSKHQFLDHISSNGDTLVKRLSKANYVWQAIAENIAHNQRTTSEVLADWLTSPGHCSNLMSSDYTQTGIAVVNRYWTQIYATPKYKLNKYGN